MGYRTSTLLVLAIIAFAGQCLRAQTGFAFTSSARAAPS
jgi:hypothetical protein